MERDSLSQKWGITIQGGADLSLTAKVASVKRFSPADRAGLEKMDYVWTVNGKEVRRITEVLSWTIQLYWTIQTNTWEQILVYSIIIFIQFSIPKKYLYLADNGLI